jgi:cold shock CspA family protein
MSNTDEIYTGVCKWFNNKTGFGFLTVISGGDGSKDGTDIFAHHSGTVVGSEQYRYLVQGEYVNFVIGASSGGKHSVQASKITGIGGGQLMCESRNDARIASDSRIASDNTRLNDKGGGRRNVGSNSKNASWVMSGGSESVLEV